MTRTKYFRNMIDDDTQTMKYTFVSFTYNLCLPWHSSYSSFTADVYESNVNAVLV